MKKRLLSLLLMVSVIGIPARAMECDDIGSGWVVVPATQEHGTQTPDFKEDWKIVPFNPNAAVSRRSNLKRYFLAWTGASAVDEGVVCVLKSAVTSSFAKNAATSLYGMMAGMWAKLYGGGVVQGSNALVPYVAPQALSACGRVLSVVPVVSGGNVALATMAAVVTYKMAIGIYTRFSQNGEPEETVIMLWARTSNDLNEYIRFVGRSLFSKELERVSFDTEKIAEICQAIQGKGVHGVQHVLEREIRVFKELFSALIVRIVGAMRKSLPLEEYYAGLEDTYLDNFSQNLVDTFGINYREVYPFIGTTSDYGIEMALSQIAQLIDTKCVVLQGAGHNEADVQFLKRQLFYMFANAEQKEEYDAFIRGRSAVGKLDVSAPEGQLELLAAKMHEVGSIISELDDIASTLHEIA